MSDPPYGLDFFSQITNLQFGSNWLGVNLSSIVNNTGGLVTQEIDFPDQAGGTPGYIPLIAGPFLNVEFAPYVSRKLTLPNGTYTVVPGDLTATLVSNAGAKMIGFGIQQVAGFYGSCMMFKLDSLFPSRPFRVNCSFSGVGPSFQSIEIFTLKNIMKAGLLLISQATLGPTPTSFQFKQPLAVPSTTTFVVDPTSLSVSPF